MRRKTNRGHKRRLKANIGGGGQTMMGRGCNGTAQYIILQVARNFVGPHRSMRGVRTRD